MSDTITMSEQEILDQIQTEVADNRVFLYMKGNPEMPRCGFSNQVVQASRQTSTSNQGECNG